MNNPFYRYMARGRIAPDRITVQLKTGSLERRPIPEAFLEGAWNYHLSLGNKPWPNDLKPSRFRLAEVIDFGKYGVGLKLDPCVSYRDFLGSLAFGFEERFGYEVVPSPLAVSVVIVTSDNHFIVTLRVKYTDYKHMGYHVSTGGFMNVPKNWDGSLATLGDSSNPTIEALRELREEAGIEMGEIEDLICCGVAYNPVTVHADVIYKARTLLTAEEVLSRKNDGENKVFAVPATLSNIETWLTGFPNASVMIALAGLMEVGRDECEKVGVNPDRWEEDIINHFKACAEGYKTPFSRKKFELHDIDKLWQAVAELGGPERPK